LGFRVVGRDCQRLFYLWLETARDDSFYRRGRNDRGILSFLMAADVPDLRRLHRWLLVGAQAGILKKGFDCSNPFTLTKVPADY
jgi:hypothetical protein